MRSVNFQRVLVNVKYKIEKNHMLELFIYFWERLKEIAAERHTGKLSWDFVKVIAK